MALFILNIIFISGCSEPEQVSPDKQLIRSEIRSTCEDWAMFYGNEDKDAMIRTLENFIAVTQVNKFKYEFRDDLEASKLNGLLSLNAAFGNFSAARDSLFRSKKTYPIKSGCVDQINDEGVVQDALSWHPKYEPTFFETIKKKIGL